MAAASAPAPNTADPTLERRLRNRRASQQFAWVIVGIVSLMAFSAIAGFLLISADQSALNAARRGNRELRGFRAGTRPGRKRRARLSADRPAGLSGALPGRVGELDRSSANVVPQLDAMPAPAGSGLEAGSASVTLLRLRDVWSRVVALAGGHDQRAAQELLLAQHGKELMDRIAAYAGGYLALRDARASATEQQITTEENCDPAAEFGGGRLRHRSADLCLRQFDTRCMAPRTGDQDHGQARRTGGAAVRHGRDAAERHRPGGRKRGAARHRHRGCSPAFQAHSMCSTTRATGSIFRPPGPVMARAWAGDGRPSDAGRLLGTEARQAASQRGGGRRAALRACATGRGQPRTADGCAWRILRAAGAQYPGRGRGGAADRHTTDRHCAGRCDVARLVQHYVA